MALMKIGKSTMAKKSVALKKIEKSTMAKESGIKIKHNITATFIMFIITIVCCYHRVNYYFLTDDKSKFQ
jgi:hypothetical protein